MRELLCLASLLLVFASLPSCGGPEMPANGLGDSTGGTGGGGGGGGPTGGGGGNPGDPPPPTPDPPPPPPAGDPNAGLSFLWKVNSVNVTPPAFVDAPGPAGAAKNEMSRLQYSPQLALTLYRRWIPGSAVSLLEVAIWNDPLTCTNQPVAGGVIPSVSIPNIEISVAGGQLYPLLPALTCWQPVIDGVRYSLPLSAAAKKICDGAGFVWPFLVSTAPDLPKFTDLAALFPTNPGSMWTTVANNFPTKPDNEVAELTTGGLYFPANADPWQLMGKDVQYTPTTGFQPDWFWCHLGAYYARNDLIDILYIMPTVYRQAARPCHFHGLDGSDPGLTFNFCRPGKWSTNYLGRVPTDFNADSIAPYADDHGWYGYDHQHASIRRVAEFAEATGFPFAWQETRYFGEVAKCMLRLIDPAPYGNGFANTPRGYLGWLEIAYRAWRLDPTYDMSFPIKVFEDFLETGHTQPFGKAWGQPQVMWAFVNDKWLTGGVLASASFEDLRAVPILLKVGQQFARPKLITGALEKSQWYATTGWTNGAEGKGIGIKNYVAPLTPNNFAEADLSGYGRADGLGYYLASQYLTANPTPGFNTQTITNVAQLIKDDCIAQSNWKTDLSGWIPW
jgi:hypothetical protein